MHIMFMIRLPVHFYIIEIFATKFHRYLICYRFYKGVIHSFYSGKKKHKVI